MMFVVDPPKAISDKCSALRAMVNRRQTDAQPWGFALSWRYFSIGSDAFFRLVK